MRFDTVIGNPPYQNGKNSNFYVKFIEKSAEHLKEGGHFGFVIPNRFLLPHTPAARSLCSNYQLYLLRSSVNDHFPDVGTSIGTVTGTRSEAGHRGRVALQLEDGSTMPLDPKRLTVPTRSQTQESIDMWSQISSLPSYEVENSRPESGQFVFIRRQWRSKGGKVFLDAVVGDHPEGHTDGRYIRTDDPETVSNHLRGDIGPAIHKLFGDQMNVWPCLWSHLPTSSAWKTLKSKTQ